MIQLVVGQLVERGGLGKVLSWPRRYYTTADADAEGAHQGSSPREIVAVTLGRRGVQGVTERGRRREDELGELEREVLAVARELGLCNLDGLHTTISERHHVSFPDMLTAVRDLVRRRLLVRRRKDNRYVYEVRGDA